MLLSVKCDKPVLTNAKLCQAAGKVPLHQKSDRPIRVAARSKRQARKSTKKRTSRRKREVGRKAAKRSNTAHKKSSERSVGKAKKGTTSPKRPLRSLRSGPFRRQCTEDPDDPISDGEICLRPNKQLRNTPEKRERKEPCPTIEICRVSDRAGKASPSAIGVGKGLGHVDTNGDAGVSAPAHMPAPHKEGSCGGESASLPVGNFGIISLFDGVSSIVPALCQKLQPDLFWSCKLLHEAILCRGKIIYCEVP